MSEKILLSYDPATGYITDMSGYTMLFKLDAEGYQQESDKSEITLELIKQGVKPDEIVKLKNAGLV